MLNNKNTKLVLENGVIFSGSSIAVAVKPFKFVLILE